MKQLSIAAIAVGLLNALPAGAVDGVKLLTQPRTFPIVISTAGSYRLKHNLTVPDANTTAISVQADDVTIDLNGFSILGPTVCSGGPSVSSCSPAGSGKGIDAGTHTAITVRNGRVRGVGGTAIALGDASTVDGVTTISNGGDGVLNPTTITNSVASSNGFNGIEGTGTTTVVHCTASSNHFTGIINASTVTGSTTDANGSDGIHAITVTGSAAEINVGTGITATTVTGCTAGGNTSSQIAAPGITGQNICNNTNPCP